MLDSMFEARLRDARPNQLPDVEVTQAVRVVAISENARALPLSRHRRWVIATAAAIAIVIAAPAVALTTGVIEFDKTPRVSHERQLRFSELVDRGAPPEMDPRVVPFSARYVSSFSRGRETVDLWVAPTDRGGFCYSFTNFTSGCRATRTVNLGSVVIPLGEFRPWLIDLTTYRTGTSTSPRTLAGNVLALADSRIFVSYADGERLELSVTWVSPPISAGFFFLEIGEDSQVSALELETHDGELIARTASQFR